MAVAGTAEGYVAPRARWSQQRIAPWVFMAPALLFFGVYVVWPIIQSFQIGLYDWDGFSEKTWIGTGNYEELFDDDRFWTSVWNNVLWLFLFLLALPIGLAIALFLNQTVFGIRLIKSLFFFPFVISQVVVGLVFAWFYDPNNGLLNEVIGVFGFGPTAMLSDENTVTVAIIAAGLWPQVAYCMILYLTGLNSVDPEQIEAARLDGARGMKLLWFVVLPQLRPATFIALVVTMIGALRSFDLVQVMTDGGPFGQSLVLGLFMYHSALFEYRMGYGAAIATVLFLIMSVFIAFFLWRMVRGERQVG